MQSLVVKSRMRGCRRCVYVKRILGKIALNGVWVGFRGQGEDHCTPSHAVYPFGVDGWREGMSRPTKGLATARQEFCKILQWSR